MRAYIRPLGEPNRCLNVYAAYDCEGNPRDAAHSPRWYKRAFRRIYIDRPRRRQAGGIDARLRDAGLPPLQSDVGGLPKAPVEVIWSPLPAGSPTVPQNRPATSTPARWVDWVGTDIYADNQDWKALDGLYRRFRRSPSRSPSGASPPATTRLRKQADDLGRAPPPLQDARLLPGLRLDQLLPDPELAGEPRRAAQLHPHGRFPSYAPFPPKPPPPPGGVAPEAPSAAVLRLRTGFLAGALAWRDDCAGDGACT